MRRSLAMLAALGLTLGLTTPALADAGASAPTPARAHCVGVAQEVDDPRPAPRLRCYATFPAAIAAATGGTITLPAGATVLSAAVYDAAVAAAPGARGPGLGASILGISYQQSSFRGWSYTVTSTDSTGCASAKVYRVSSVPRAYDDQISSARTYGGCKSTHYSSAGLAGASHLCGCASMGAMNDRTSSIRFSRSG